MPARSSATLGGDDRPDPEEVGIDTATPAARAHAPIGSGPCASTPCSTPSRIAAAPSFIGDELPAVTVPSARKTGLELRQRLDRGVGRARIRRRFSSDAEGATISPSNRPAPRPSAARRWLATANSSCISRVDPYSLGEDLGALAERAPSIRRMAGVDHPPAERGRVHRWCAALVRAGRASARPTGRGVIDSTPPAIAERGVADRDLADWR